MSYQPLTEEEVRRIATDAGWLKWKTKKDHGELTYQNPDNIGDENMKFEEVIMEVIDWDDRDLEALKRAVDNELKRRRVEGGT
jgi:hypothetical protein